MSSDSKVLVTGISGFVALEVAKSLLEEGFKVRGSVRSLTDENKVNPVKKLFEEAKQDVDLVEADLLNAESWEEAVKDCQFVVHTASPFPDKEPSNPDDVIKPTTEGTLNVLKACAKAKCVKRVVLTSSVAAMGGTFGDTGVDSDKPLNEESWANTDGKLSTYAKAKTLAEKAAWDFVEKLEDDDKFELVAVNPGYILGPLNSNNPCTSMQLHKHLLEHKLPLLLKCSISLTDVRDVAAAHVKAMTLPEVAGTRTIIVSETMWMKEFAEILDKEFRSKGYRVPTGVSPKFLAKLYAVFDKSVKMLMPTYGKEVKYDNTRMKEVFGITPIEGSKSILDMANSMIERGLVKKPKEPKPKSPSKKAKEEASAEKKEDEVPAEIVENGEEVKKTIEDSDIKAVDEKTDEEEEDLKKSQTIEEAAATVTKVEVPAT